MVHHIIMATLLHIILITVIIFILIDIIMFGDFVGIQDHHTYITIGIITIGIDILETIRSIQEVMEYRDQADPHIIMGQ
jgi:hypothetical protein